MVSVTVHIVRDDSIHPIESTIGTAISGPASSNAIGTAIVSLSTIEGERAMPMNASARLYLLRLTNPCHGLASDTFSVILSRASPNCIDSGGASCNGLVDTREYVVYNRLRPTISLGHYT